MRSPAERAARLVPPPLDLPRRAPWTALGCVAAALPLALARSVRRVAAFVALALAVVGLALAAGWLALRAAPDDLGLVARTALRIAATESGDGGGLRLARADTFGGVAQLAALEVEDVLEELSSGDVRGPRVSLARQPAAGMRGIGARGGAEAGLVARLVVDLRAGGGGGPATWTLVAPRGAWVVERSFGAGFRVLQPEVNTLCDLAEVFVREASGAWSRRGSWALGGALPGGGAEGVAPPGWLAVGLPQGVRVLVARLAPGAWAGPEPGVPQGTQAGAAQDPERWLRCVDF
ncbi:MAG: hypothetical protein R3F49_19555 [Planctomycetota bacterium]